MIGMIDVDASGDIEGISSSRIADENRIVEKVFTAKLRKKFEIFSYRNSATILESSYPLQFSNILKALEAFEITKKMIRLPGGNKGPIASYVDTLFIESDGWKETRITADLHVKLLHAKSKNKILADYIREGYLDGHRIDFLNDRVALDFEWNSKDQTYDRDLYAFSAFYEAGAIDVGVIITRGTSLDNKYFRGLGKVLKPDGTEGAKDVYSKYGASTTWMGKLLYRLDAGRNGGCPVLAIGITPCCIN